MQNENKFKCPCHGSQYNAEGKVVRGPAPLVRLLQHRVPSQCRPQTGGADVGHNGLMLALYPHVCEVRDLACALQGFDL